MEEPSPAGDIYSLAATLYALLSGRPPHFPPEGSPSIHALIAAHMRPVADIPGAPPALTAVLRQSMAYDPAARPPSAAALRDAIAAADLNAAPAYGPHNAEAHALPAMPQPAAPPTGPGPQHAVAYGPYPPQPTGPGSQYGFQTSQPMAQQYQHTGPGGAAGTTPAVPGKRGASKGMVLGAAGLITAAILGVGALVAFSSSGGSNGGGTAGSPTVSNRAAPEPSASASDPRSAQASTLLTPAAIRRVIGLFEQASHNTEFAGMTVYAERAKADAPVAGRHDAFDEYTYELNADAAVRQGPSVAITTGDAKVNLRSFNWDALPNLLRRARQVLKVPKPTDTYVIVDPAWAFNGDQPTLLVYLTDDYGGGYLAADTKGNVIKTYPAGG